MERLIVNAEGKVVIPPEVIQRRGLRPGDELMLVEAAEGLLVYQGGSDPETAAWWNSLSEDERLCISLNSARRFTRRLPPGSHERCHPGTESAGAGGSEATHVQSSSY